MKTDVSASSDEELPLHSHAVVRHVWRPPFQREADALNWFGSVDLAAVVFEEDAIHLRPGFVEEP